MLKKKWGRIINLSSQLAHKGAGFTGCQGVRVSYGIDSRGFVH